MDFAAKFDDGLAYDDFLAKFGTDEHNRRWSELRAQVRLTAAQQSLLTSFVREMKVLCLAGAWCGDCVNQCPILDCFAAENQKIQIRYFDRDQDQDLTEALKICGGMRVPVVVFLAEDGAFCGLCGDRTLTKYRQMAQDQLGPACPTGLGSDMPLLDGVIQDWLNEFERIQLMLRCSPRLRKSHND